MKRKFFALALILALCLSLLPGASAADAEAPVPAIPGKTLHHAEDLDIAAIEADLQQLPAADWPESAPSRSVPAARDTNPIEDAIVFPFFNYVEQYRVVGSTVRLDYVSNSDYLGTSPNGSYYGSIVLVYPGDPSKTNPVYDFRGSWGSFTVNWQSAGNPAGTYTVVLGACYLDGDYIRLVTDTVLSYEVYLTNTEVPAEGVYIYDAATGEIVTGINVEKGFSALTTLTLGFIPENTTVDRTLSISLNSRWAQANEYAGFMKLYAKDYAVEEVWFSARGASFKYLTVNICTDTNGHVFGDPVFDEYDREPSCLYPGGGTIFCEKCGASTLVDLPPLGHDWVPGEIIKEETEDSFGTRMFECSRCGLSEKRTYHTCPGEAFTDHVKDSNWAHKPIDFVVRQGLMTGTTATTFDPKMNLDRGQLVTILYRMNGSPKVENTETPFTDLNKNYYKKAVAWAYQNGIVTGTTATTFEPSTVVTREVFATMLYRYYVNYCHNNAGELADLSIFPDAGMTHNFARKPMAWAVANGIITGTGSALSPEGNATREQAAAILMRFLQNLPQG